MIRTKFNKSNATNINFFLIFLFCIITNNCTSPYHRVYDDPNDIVRSFPQEKTKNFYITPTVINSIHRTPQSQKSWTIIIYMSADNDLRGFAARNIKQMAAIGSNQFINIVIQLDIRLSGNRKITRRYYVENNNVTHVNDHDPESQGMDSGAPETLISCCRWAINDYPADNFALIFWNHGTGILDPNRGRIINATELFNFNPTLRKFELNRSIEFLDYINKEYGQDQRGICWDDSTGNYLTNQALDYALGTIQQQFLRGKKFSIIGFDACLMAMLEVANIIKKYADIMVGSQEVELGTGWNYKTVLEPFALNSMEKHLFAQHIVRAYATTYESITNDFTLSAMDLSVIDDLEQNINQVAHVLLECLRLQHNGSVKKIIKTCRDRFHCTYFDEPSYIDQYHFYTNLLNNLNAFELFDYQQQNFLQTNLRQLLEQGLSLINRLVLANTAGPNLSQAKGISIYFPERRIHPSYANTTFAKNNAWNSLINTFLAI